MGTLKKDFKYKLVKNFLTKDEQEFFTYYSLLKHKTNLDEMDFVQSNVADSAFYGDKAVDTLMISKRKLMEKETGLTLSPTYSFFRVYTYDAELTKHKDRPSCEVSVTVMFGSDGTKWPIFMDGNEVELTSGDAVIYLGCELEHWREHFKGDWHAQAFLHYVDKNGPNKEFAFDQRDFYNSPTITFNQYNKK